MNITKTAALAVAITLLGTVTMADTAPPPSIFDGLPDPNHLNDVVDSDQFLNYHRQSFVQVATMRSVAGAREVRDQLADNGIEARMYNWERRGKRVYVVVMVHVTSRDEVRSTLRAVRRLGFRDAFFKNYVVPRS